MAPPIPTVISAAALEAAFKAGKKSAVCWLAVPSHAPRLVWAGWLAGGIALVVGGGEQEVPGLVGAAAVLVTVPAGADVLTVSAIPEVIHTGSELWSTVAGPLAERRLNSGTPAELLEHWSVAATLVRLTLVTGRR